MITPYQLLQEAGFAQYTAMVRFHYNRENTSLGAEKIAEMVRAIPGATRVSTVSLDKAHGIGIFNVKIISQKPPKEAYVALKQNALERYRGLITGVEVGANTIETKGDFIIKENDTYLQQCLKGILLEEGLLLEVSIEDLKKQFVECDPPKLTEEVFNQIVQACNNESNFATWMCKKVATGIINTEDLRLWHDIFEFFKRYKQRFQKKDINQVKTADDVHAFVADYNRVYDEVEAKKATGQTQKSKDETDQCLLGTLKSEDGKSWLAYKTNPGQWKLERKIGSGTKWCTVASEYYFDYYMGPGGNNDAAYYIFINKADPKEKYQIHYGSNQCKDSSDTEVDYSTPFVQDFYKYLEKVDNRTDWPSNAVRGKTELEARKKLAEEVEKHSNELDNLSKESTSDGTLYKHVFFESDRTEYKLKDVVIFRDLGLNVQDAISLYRKLSRYGRKEGIIVKPNSGDWDLVYSYDSWNNDSTLSSFKNQRNYRGDADLPLANDSNIDLYKAACRLLSPTVKINSKVLIRCDKSLPSLESFKFKSEEGRVAYKMPRNERSYKALLETGVSDTYIDNINNPQYFRGKTIYAYSGPEFHSDAGNLYVFTEVGSKLLIPGGIGGTEKGCINNRIKIYKFVGINPTEAIYDPDVVKYSKVGGIEGLKEDLSNKPSVEGFSDQYEVGTSRKLAILLSEDENNPVFFIRKKDDFNNIVIAHSARSGNNISKYSINDPTAEAYLRTQGAILTLKNYVAPIDIAKFCVHAGVPVPECLQKFIGRLRNVSAENINIFGILNQQKDHFEEYRIPYCRRNWGDRSAYTINARGIYGTWDQLKSAFKVSCPSKFNQINAAIEARPGSRCDAFVYYNHESSRRDWNCLVRVIDQNNKVVWTLRRKGSGPYLDWAQDTPSLERQADAHSFPTNYAAPQPPAPRVRGQRAAQAQQQATPALETTPEVRQQLEQYKRNSQNSQELYVIPREQCVTLLAALGFTNLTVDGINKAIVYKAAPHNGATSHVAILDIQNQNTLVAGYPQNPNIAAARQCSTQWRALTRQLDNSVRTFQQCTNICQEFNVSLPTALQGWLVYRGQGQAQVAPNNR